jgi:hypothetical protein
MCWAESLASSNSDPAAPGFIQATGFQQFIQNRLSVLPNESTSDGVLENGIKINPFALVKMTDCFHKEVRKFSRGLASFARFITGWK